MATPARRKKAGSGVKKGKGGKTARPLSKTKLRGHLIHAAPDAEGKAVSDTDALYDEEDGDEDVDLDAFEDEDDDDDDAPRQRKGRGGLLIDSTGADDEDDPWD